MRAGRWIATWMLAAMAFAAGCDEVAESDAVRPSWTEGQEFVVETTRRVSTAATEVQPTVDLETGVASGDPLGERWTDPAYWTYHVIHAGYEPPRGDELRRYHDLDGRPSTLTVIRAHLSPTMNWGHELLASDPKVYLVIREDRDRLAAVVSFYTMNGVRMREAYDLPTTARATNLLSQSDLVSAPTYLPPFPLLDRDGVRTMENGHDVFVTTRDDGSVDVVFDDEVDGNLVHQRWERGAPFPRQTVTPDLEARLLSASEVEALQLGDAPRTDLPDPGSEDWDFVEALEAAVDLQAALSILEQDLGDSSFAAVEGYRPWAGSWWPQADGELVFGYSGRATISDEIKGEVDPLRLDLDTLSEELRDMDSGSAEYATKVEEYKTRQGELADVLVEFYDGLLAGLDGGEIVVAEGKITRGEEWTYELDELSPFDKFALYEYLSGHTYPNPFFLPAWELLNHYSPGGGSWWGHCNGWSAAAILTNEPRESRTVEVAGHTLTFTTADLKGLLTESHYSQYSHFYGERYNGEEQDIEDLYPDAFHRIVGFYIRDRGVPLVFDTSAGDAVWNYPAWSYTMDIEETTDEATAGLVNLNTATREELIELPEIGEAKADAIIEHRLQSGPFQSVEDVLAVDGIGDGTYEAIKALVTVDALQRSFAVEASVRFTTDGVGETHVDMDENAPQGFSNSYRYTLTADDQGLVTGGSWSSSNQHPDFAWVPYYNPRYPSQNGSENGYLDFGHLADMLGPEALRQ